MSISSHSKILLIALVSLLAGWQLSCQPPAPTPPEPPKVPVTSEILQERPFRPEVHLYGVVAPAGQRELLAGGTGRIAFPKRYRGGLPAGGRIARGDTLFWIVDPAIELRLTERRLDAEQAEAELERARRGAEQGFLSVADLDEAVIRAQRTQQRLAAARGDLQRTRTTAPASGILRVARVIVEGEQVESGQIVAELATDGSPRIEAWAAAGDLSSLGTGLQAECLGSASDRILGTGRIDQVSSHVDGAGVGKVVLVIDRDLAMPRPGEGVRVRVLLQDRPRAITLPESAISTRGNLSTVFVLEPSGSDWKARSRLVQLGVRGQGQVEILDGLAAGERVALEGVELLAEGILARDVSPLGEEP